MRVEIWNIPISHWHVKIAKTGKLWCEVFGLKPTRTVYAHLAPEHVALVVQECSEVPRTSVFRGQDCIVLHVELDSGPHWLALNDLPAESPSRKIVDAVLDRVIRQTMAMSGIVEIPEAI